jgi:hypothetical protein
MGKEEKQKWITDLLRRAGRVLEGMGRRHRGMCHPKCVVHTCILIANSKCSIFSCLALSAEQTSKDDWTITLQTTLSYLINITILWVGAI